MTAHRARKPTVVLLVRHARTETTGVSLPGRRAGLHLAPEGRRDAEAVGARLARRGDVRAVYTSPLERACETASAIAAACRLVPRVEAGLIELDVGRWSGRKLSDLARTTEWRQVQRHPSGFRFPGGESFAEMQVRVAATLSELVRRHPGATIVAVSHGDPIKGAVAHALGIPLDLFQRIAIAPASTTAVAYRQDGPMVLAMNIAADPAAKPAAR
jgi:probable phosphoglycerate mutase